MCAQNFWHPQEFLGKNASAQNIIIDCKLTLGLSSFISTSVTPQNFWMSVAETPTNNSLTIPRIVSACKGSKCVGWQPMFYYTTAEPKACYVLCPSAGKTHLSIQKGRGTKGQTIKQTHLSHTASIYSTTYFLSLCTTALLLLHRESVS